MGSPLRTPGQNRQIHGLLNQIRKESGLSREDTDALKERLCTEVSGQPRSSKLTKPQAARVIAQLADRLSPREGSQDRAQQASSPEKASPRGISKKQVEVLQAMFAQAGMKDRRSQMGFTRRQCGKPWAQSQRDVSKVMTPLREMVLRKLRPREIWARFRALQGRPELDTWQRGFVENVLEQFRQAEQGQTLDQVMSTHKLSKLVEAELRCGIAHG